MNTLQTSTKQKRPPARDAPEPVIAQATLDSDARIVGTDVLAVLGLDDPGRRQLMPRAGGDTRITHS